MQHLERPLSRENYVKAIAMIAEFLQPAIGIVAANRLRYLATELDDLDRGTIGDLLTPVGKSKPRRSNEWYKHAESAVAYECLIRAGDDPKNAAKKIAAAQNYSGKATVAPWEQVINVHHSFRYDRVKNQLARATWEFCLGQINELSSPAELRNVANILIGDVSLKKNRTG
jgi:hypothetical protein